MAARGRVPTTLDGRFIQASGTVRQGTVPGLSPVVVGHRQVEIIHHPELLEAKIAAQAAEIKQLVGDNQRLASTQLVLREELVVAQQEVQTLKAHMKSIQTESDIQIRVLVDKIARAEADIRAGEAANKDLQQARKDAQSLVAARRELNHKIQEAKKELQKAHGDVKSMPDLNAEVESLKKELQRLRDTFEYEKGLNIEQVEQLQAMEKKLISMAGEVEKLKLDIFRAEKRAQGPSPYVGGYVNLDFPYRPSIQGSIARIDSYARPHDQMGVWPGGDGKIAYGSSGVVAAAGAAFPPTGGPPVRASGGFTVPTNADAAVPGSAGASASTSGGDAAHAQG